MCTAATYQSKDFYFGRTLDYEFSYQETVTVTPRNYPFHFRRMHTVSTHYAMIGMAFVVGDYPLYYDATNEKGLSMAGLNFVGNAYYGEALAEKDNIASFEIIPWILGQCATLKAAKALLEDLNLIHLDFSEELPCSPLHWIIADQSGAITVEAMKDGLKIYDNPVGILTNNPPFDYQMFQLNHYMNLSKDAPENHFLPELKLECYSRGMGSG